MFVADGTGRVRALAMSNGRERWSTLADPTGRILGGNLLVRGGILIALGAFEVIGMNTSDGVVRWRYQPPVDSLVQPLRPGYLGLSRMDADERTVFVPAWGASVSALDIQTGALRWTWGTGDTTGFRSGSNGVRVHGDTVYATAWHFTNRLGGLSEPWLLALDKATGRELWRKTFLAYTSGVAVEGSPAVHGALVIFAAEGGHEYAVNRFTTELVWWFNPRAMWSTISQTELFDGVAYHDGGDEHIYALDAATGRQLWKGRYNGNATDLLVTKRRVYVPGGARTMTVLDRRTGAVVTRLTDPTGDILHGLFGAPGAYAQGRVFFGVSNGAACFREP